MFHKHLKLLFSNWNLSSSLNLLLRLRKPSVLWLLFLSYRTHTLIKSCWFYLQNWNTSHRCCYLLLVPADMLSFLDDHYSIWVVSLLLPLFFWIFPQDSSQCNPLRIQVRCQSSGSKPVMAPHLRVKSKLSNGESCHIWSVTFLISSPLMPSLPLFQSHLGILGLLHCCSL